MIGAWEFFSFRVSSKFDCRLSTLLHHFEKPLLIIITVLYITDLTTRGAEIGLLKRNGPNGDLDSRL